jgi:hypothetical protein
LGIHGAHAMRHLALATTLPTQFSCLPPALGALVEVGSVMMSWSIATFAAGPATISGAESERTLDSL